ncbi:PAS domain S-box protein [Polaromonas sp.]|jgi:PAS domain S-box-containing protein|uniref:PAS domain S-box protein n=1 Tax=Polaromonas sp. TaxID=1869339 RepID=UPI002B6F2D6E|nr:PAS domain S-box protein [Polaromonas sp.]HQS31998.1 PAS domain S-box protein [Polaromonas sp.]HQS91282.1 PAS domain S-box protein [Polaromonas sp.]
MSPANTTLKTALLSKGGPHRITLVAGTILLVLTVLVGTAVFIIMARHAEELLSKSLQMSLENRAQLVQSEIGAGLDKTMVVATRPLLLDQMQRLTAGADDAAARVVLNKAVQSFLSTGLTAIALFDKDGREVTRAGTFANRAALTVPLKLPGPAQLLWDGRLVLHSMVDMKRGGQVIGQVMAETLMTSTYESLTDINLLGETGELALCAAQGANMLCFPTRLNPGVMTLPKKSAQGVPRPMTYALDGATGVVATQDYRHQQVVAAYQPVGDLALGMVLKMDRAELYAPIWAQLRLLIPLLLVLLFVALALLRWLLSPLVIRLVRSEGQAREMSVTLRDSEQRARTLLNSVDEGIVSISDSGVIELFNPAAERIFGYRSEEVVGKNVSMLIPESYHHELAGYLRRDVQTGETKVSGSGRELKGRHKSGNVFPMDVRVSGFSLGGRRHFIGRVRDITERKRIAEALRASELQLRRVTDTIPVLIAYLDNEQCFRFHNKAYEDVLGLRFDQIDGRPLAEVLGQSAYAGIQGKVEEVLRGYPVRYERAQVTAQGDIRNYAMHYFPRYGEGADQGKVLGFFSQGTDITELKRIDRMKTEFVSTVSHELRTPLTSIRGSLGLIAGGVGGEVPAAVKNLVGIAKTNCERLIRLINDILDSEKIESGKMHLDLQVFDIYQLVRQALAANDSFAAQHGVRLHLQVAEEPLKVRVDSDRMIQVLTNLLSNAVKFSPSGGSVEIEVMRVARSIRVEVKDHGPGIPEEFRSRIFQKFSQADSSDTRKMGGTGLGLNISRSLIEQMNGAISFTSDVGLGTSFYFELPEWKEPVRRPMPVGSLTAPVLARILVCEDNPDIAKLIGLMLENAGFEADVAYSAEDALACLGSSRYDAITVDLTLPGQQGAAFIGALRRDVRTQGLPVVVISASEDEGQLHFNGKPLAISDWLDKPIDEDRLIASLRRAVAGLANGKPRVLHVEDDPDIQCIAAAIAENYASFEFASTLAEARALLRQQTFDLVLLDLTLGDDSGWSLFEDIDKLRPRPPVIVFSASDVSPADSRLAEAVLIKAHTSNSELLLTIQRVLKISGDPGPTRPMSLS